MVCRLYHWPQKVKHVLRSNKQYLFKYSAYSFVLDTFQKLSVPEDTHYFEATTVQNFYIIIKKKKNNNKMEVAL